MPNGPHINNISKNFTTRDNLGIESVSATMQADTCPLINTVTPRAFYWPFMVWIYYDFYEFSGIADHTVASFDRYLKRQDYFFVLASLLTQNSDRDNLVGKQKSQDDINKNPNGPFSFNPKYFVARYGGMQYYNAGCLSMHFITDYDYSNDANLKFPALRPEGKEMAKAFESIIKDTEYYKNYRLTDAAVPKHVLEEYGKVINLGLKGFDSCKEKLKQYMFNDDRASQLKLRSQQIRECADYIKFLEKSAEVTESKLSDMRRMLFDHETPAGIIIEIPASLHTISNKWEIIIGRQYFTAGIEMLWKFILEQLNEPFTVKEWIQQSLSCSEFEWDIEEELSTVIDSCIFDFSSREAMINSTKSRNTSTYSIENGIKILLSVFNRLYDRSDLGDERAFFDYGIDNNSIPLSRLFELVEEYKNKSIKQFIIYILEHWIIEQHYITALEKLIQNRDGFYYENIDGRYVRKHEFELNFQGIRLIQLSQVMKDLEMI